MINPDNIKPIPVKFKIPNDHTRRRNSGDNGAEVV